MSCLERQCHSYTRLEKEDPDEVRHRKARFLIYKTLERAASPSRRCRRRRRSCFRLKTIGRPVVAIGARLGRLWKRRLFSGQGGGSGVFGLPAVF
ncbi:hypothetical protein QJS04_geneDACA018047 [Acorus gramineus]|uniref:Uncharacterized protein n=1 Tax=Acorus gramineus TaxID=55184 RepID=A0AAV9A8A0_ACOGR|nr:hypothetical protein QJS04_geneDACA018047 [Acorus gramineus]